MLDYIIEVDSATKEFKTSKVLQEVSVKFERGKIHGIIGRNGSGKTMLFKSILGFTNLSSGNIYINGKKSSPNQIHADIGIIIETPGFLPHLSGYKNLKLLAAVLKRATDDEVRQAIRLVGLDDKSRKRVSKYSMGMRQRLGIAQAIMEHPKILILDEPLNGLDNLGVQQMRQLFLELKEKGVTILMASHNGDDIRMLCDTVHEMDGGRITSIKQG